MADLKVLTIREEEGWEEGRGKQIVFRKVGGKEIMFHYQCSIIKDECLNFRAFSLGRWVLNMEY